MIYHCTIKTLSNLTHNVYDKMANNAIYPYIFMTAKTHR